MNSDACEFCIKFGTSSGPRRWFDVELRTSANDLSVTVPGIGAPSPGYVLVIPRIHYPSFLAMPSFVRAETEILLDSTMRTIEAIYGSATAFEHGTGASNYGGYRGPCIEHAHIHVLPLFFDLSMHLHEDYPNAKDFSLDEIPELLRNTEYLGVKRSRKAAWHYSFSPNPRPPSQYFRRRIFELLDRGDEYDYVMHTGEPSIRQTIFAFDRISSAQ